MGTNSGESGARNLEAESIRNRAEEYKRVCKVEDIDRNNMCSARDTFTAESVYLVLNSLLDWEPVERWKQRNDVVSFTLLFVRGEQHRIFL